MENLEEQSALELAEERLRLEREAIALERERLAAARAHADAANALAHSSKRTFLVASSITLLAALCFAGGLLTGFTIMEGRQQRLREERLSRALSQLDDLAGSSSTNAPSATGQKTDNAHPNVAVMVIQ